MIVIVALLSVMGCCSSCCFPSADEGSAEERTPLQPRHNSYGDVAESTNSVPNRAQYYQSIVDDARKYVAHVCCITMHCCSMLMVYFFVAGSLLPRMAEMAVSKRKTVNLIPR